MWQSLRNHCVSAMQPLRFYCATTAFAHRSPINFCLVATQLMCNSLHNLRSSFANAIDVQSLRSCNAITVQFAVQWLQATLQSPRKHFAIAIAAQSLRIRSAIALHSLRNHCAIAAPSLYNYFALD
jgi:hypothetical protein